MRGDQAHHHGRLVIRVEFGPVDHHHDLPGVAHHLGYPVGEHLPDINPGVAEQVRAPSNRIHSGHPTRGGQIKNKMRGFLRN